MKCCLMSPEETEEIPNQCQTWDQRELNMSQAKNRCVAVSNSPQPEMHAVSVD